MTDCWKLFAPRLGSISPGNKMTTPHSLSSSYVPVTVLGVLHTLPLILANITKVSVNNCFMVEKLQVREANNPVMATEPVHGIGRI